MTRSARWPMRGTLERAGLMFMLYAFLLYALLSCRTRGRLWNRAVCCAGHTRTSGTGLGGCVCDAAARTARRRAAESGNSLTRLGQRVFPGRLSRNVRNDHAPRRRVELKFLRLDLDLRIQRWLIGDLRGNRLA